MKAVARASLAALALGLVAGPAWAQMHGNPVYYGAGTGVTIAGDFGRGLNDASFKTNYLGGRVAVGLPMFHVMVGAGSVKGTGDFESESEISFGGNVGVKLPLAAGSPLRVSLQGGVGYLSEEGFGKTYAFPIGVALAFAVPSTGVSVTPWIAPRVHIARFSPEGGGESASETRPGASAGLNIGLPVGVGFHLAVDYINFSAPEGSAGSSSDFSPFIVGVGAHYTIKVPGLGGM